MDVDTLAIAGSDAGVIDTDYSLPSRRQIEQSSVTLVQYFWP
ncbi:hypothetical protein PPEP_a3448 [Pseudoalteromonas peptidolytica F12-50-A1]|uniref:Uncharacterized protein n=1 Tax=Pseudoalteromonas peptidolytica F12-50-A1 TaxID=1315280 RepID=A0A8I0MSV2_9GAMM|nr:hypothetical protein [Pseudoalteromonas peptidolytica]MBE0345096.1 hypothetical protein [Pseudoalteromonas peptidolytica F12-50-A1]